MIMHPYQISAAMRMLRVFDAPVAPVRRKKKKPSHARRAKVKAARKQNRKRRAK